MDVVRKFWKAGNITKTLTEIRQILTPKRGDIPDSDTLLFCASICYEVGRLQLAEELLNKVNFDVFDVKQWIAENNILVLKYLGSKCLEDQRRVASSFRILLEKIRGLPYSDVQLVEPHVCFNYALLVFCSNPQQALVPGGYNVSQATLFATLQKVCTNSSEYQGKCNRSLDDKLQFYFACERDQNQEKSFVALLVWLLASNMLVRHQVSEAKKLLEVVVNFYKANEVIDDEMSLTFLLANSNNAKGTVNSLDSILLRRR